eukprot:TRINITY_DN1998_c1_g1_i9.p4 TRINITY_DN1998_c1_g1~~TRINITY_DN1998_c1_g1_i9.p4  ORF type:complete len:119 (+),score=1.56 TRINITY_DN1998_c1_g1_i9:329-685(+)
MYVFSVMDLQVTIRKEISYLFLFFTPITLQQVHIRFNQYSVQFHDNIHLVTEEKKKSISTRVYWKERGLVVKSNFSNSCSRYFSYIGIFDLQYFQQFSLLLDCLCYVVKEGFFFQFDF